ncbi:MAG: acyltransferase [archaeon]|nr:acyltransferase [archaeon]
METQKQTRLSGIELLKILAITLICISHAVQTSGSLFPLVPSLDGTIIALKLLRYSGMIGNTIFVVCSCWFLLDSKKAKTNKILNLLFDSMLISIVILVCMLIAGYNISAKEIVQQFVPDLFSRVWFVPFYVMLYAFHPLLNAGIEKMSKRTYFGLVIVLFILFVGISLVIDLPQICNLIYAFVIYLIIGYFKKYHIDLCNNKKVNLIICLVGFITFFIVAAGVFVLATKFSFLAKRPFLMYTVSPLIAIPSFAAFNLFRNMNFKSKLINCVSSCSLFIYCIHENVLLRSYVRPNVEQWCLDTFGSNLAVVWILGIALCMFIGAAIISVIYKFTAHRFTNWLANKTDNGINSLVNKFYKKIYKEN